jgi:uncharacterized protein
MKKRYILPLMASSILLSFNTAMAQTPETSTYQVITPVEPGFDYLRFGEIRPLGWIKAQMQQDLDGFAGHLDELVPDLMDDQIYGADRLTRTHTSKNLGNIGPEMDPQYLWWNSETQSNWRDGFIRNAVLLDDKEQIARAEKYYDYLLSTQDADGYLGIYSPDLRYNFSDENGELWAKTTALRGLLAYYEYSGRPEILESVVKAVDNVMKNYPANASSPFKSSKPFAGGVTHGLVFTDILDRLFQLTGNPKYHSYGLFLYKDFSENILAEDAQYAKIINPTYRLKEHGVHTYEHLRPLTLAYYASGNTELKKALEIYLNRIADCTTPSGGPIGDEWIGGRTADATGTGYEYCSLQELMDGYINLMQKSGDARFGDLAEKLFFNAAQGARLPAKSAIAYCKTDNSFEMKGTRNGEIQGTDKQTRFKYSPAHQDVAVCCVPNAGRITPYFVKSMWMKDSEGLVSALFGPNELTTTLKNTEVRIAEETEYPFSNSIIYKVSVAKPVSFTLKIRKPGWAKTFSLNCRFTEKDGYIVIRKTWKETEMVELVFTSEPECKQDRNGEKYFSSGALIFALPVESREIITKEFPAGGLKDYEYEPVSLVKYRIPASRQSEMTVKKVEIPENRWASVGLNTYLVNEKTGKTGNVTLLPLGATILRQETFTDQVRVSSGSVVRIADFPSKFVDPRNVDIWLPDGYTAKKKYAVLYMHDGQMLFDSSSNWNHQEWCADETAGKLIKEGKLKDFIIVGIWNTAKRHSEYFPQVPYVMLSAPEKEFVTAQLQAMGRTTEVFEPVSDNYLKFIVSELKPYVDKNYPTLASPKNTFIAGSSMGGLISMYALCEYPEVFGGAACLSTHWPGIFSMENNPVPDVFIGYLKNNLPDPKNHKLYFDYGDQTLDALYPPLQQKVDEVMKAKGFTARSWETRFFPGENHSEKAWSKRLEIPLLFLLKK